MMTTSIITAMEELIAILALENNALSEARLPDALKLIPQKQAAATKLETAIATASEKDACAFTGTPLLPEHSSLLEKMITLGKRNGELLQHAIASQKRVIELLTTFPSSETMQSYGHKGAYAHEEGKRQALFVSRA
ncbi:flagellar protein FlgN [Gluconobacter cerinus]